MEDDKVAPQAAALRNSPIAGSDDGGHEKAMVAEACYWNDKKYSDGATVCDAGQRYKCWNGKWVDIGNC